jgi:hypothetical protein
MGPISDHQLHALKGLHLLEQAELWLVQDNESCCVAFHNHKIELQFILSLYGSGRNSQSLWKSKEYKWEFKPKHWCLRDFLETQHASCFSDLYTHLCKPHESFQLPFQERMDGSALAAESGTLDISLNLDPIRGRKGALLTSLWSMFLTIY